MKPGSTSLYLVFGNDINSRGEIALFAFDQSDGQFRAAMAVPCNDDHALDKACDGAAQPAIAVPETTQHPKVVLPENVRQQLWKRIGFRRFGNVMMKPQ